MPAVGRLWPSDDDDDDDDDDKEKGEEIAGSMHRSGKVIGGIRTLDPDYPGKMVNQQKKTTVQKKPQYDGDFAPYLKYWGPGKNNMDQNNQIQEKSNNRFLLYGRPQIGKTGAFLHLILEI